MKRSMKKKLNRGIAFAATTAMLASSMAMGTFAAEASADSAKMCIRDRNVKDNLYAYGTAGYLYYSFSNMYEADGEMRVKRDVNRDCADASTAITLINSYEEEYTDEYMDAANDVVKEIAESGAVLDVYKRQDDNSGIYRSNFI